MMTATQAAKLASKYAPLIGIDQFGSGQPTDELQFWNYGLWLPETSDPKTASDNLLAKLLTRLPEPPARILDVAFGQGGSLRALCGRYRRENVVGVNIAADQIAHAKQAGVSCDLMLMDAADLAFGDEEFDGVLCMEAAFHFKTRAAFLRHAHRVLRPGGRLVMSDFLLRSGIALDPLVFPPENQTRTLVEYRQIFEAAGFRPDRTDISISTNEQLVPFIATMAEYAGYLPTPDPEAINISAPHSQEAILFILTRLLNIADCVLVTAEKE